MRRVHPPRRRRLRRERPVGRPAVLADRTPSLLSRADPEVRAQTELFEVLLVDGDQRWHAGVVVGEEDDLLLSAGGKVLVFGTRAGARARRAAGPARAVGRAARRDRPRPRRLAPPRHARAALAEVSELWHLLVDDPVAGRPLAGEEVGEAYDDLVDEAPDWFATHGALARRALADAVRRLRGRLRRP